MCECRSKDGLHCDGRDVQLKIGNLFHYKARDKNSRNAAVHQELFLKTENKKEMG